MMVVVSDMGKMLAHQPAGRPLSEHTVKHLVGSCSIVWLGAGVAIIIIISFWVAFGGCSELLKEPLHQTCQALVILSLKVGSSVHFHREWHIVSASPDEATCTQTN
ncbi:hypothetical protein NQZ68_021786 [Dissostichus eleginoides]|nr:hypothetical protein NQZ68_021786 [Dissostichus eleginoides]